MKNNVGDKVLVICEVARIDDEDNTLISQFTCNDNSTYATFFRIRNKDIFGKAPLDIDGNVLRTGDEVYLGCYDNIREIASYDKIKGIFSGYMDGTNFPYRIIDESGSFNNYTHVRKVPEKKEEERFIIENGKKYKLVEVEDD